MKTLPNEIWLLFDSPEDEEPSHEANVYRVNGGAVVAWSHTAVGQVTEKSFPTVIQARQWLAACGYEAYSPLS